MSPARGDTGHDEEDLTSPLAFVDLMALERIEDSGASKSSSSEPEKVERFRSLATPFPPGEGNRSFGGHVFAQSAYAASKTVGKGFLVHDMTGTFILGGRLDVPYIYVVRHLRDGYMYCTRAVDVRQDGKLVFSCLCSFKRDEGQHTFDHQPSGAQGRFRDVLSGTRPEDQPVSPSVDVDWWIETVREGNITEREFPGLDVRKVDMKAYNKTKKIQEHPEKYRQLTQYRLKGSPDGDPSASLAQIRKRELAGEYDNLYACAHMYSSDKNSLLLIPRALGIKHFADMASLTLMVIIHRRGNALRMIDWDAVCSSDNVEVPMKWFTQEGWTPQSGENRAVHESHLWSPDGKLLATSMQDSMLRLRKLGREGNL